MTATIAAPTTARSDSPVRIGVFAGLAGGVVFGLLMAGVGMLPTVGMLIGVDNAFVGFLVHLVVSAIAGGLFGLISRKVADKMVPVYAMSALYGVVWWLLGALIVMPLWLSVTADSAMSDMVFVVGNAQWVSLFGHVFFGWVTGATLLALRGHAR
ncbi:hypothetical protein [Saccharothrix variisporea]|uniref:Uncharacterized protein n=1 Tax=Saccharothrix variisporea TaxID=543527 RepID=A0A495X3N9_9PSEU|nr:hypothetical protein [Saccharothrix variisporea]RKT67243.1 hypothetical protein DFJ66_0415 [Saccharothrix variisporea]